MRSRIAIQLKDGGTFAGWADERYRGGPENPLSDADVEAKLRSCCEGVLNENDQSRLIEAAWSVDQLQDASTPMKIINNL
jgi:2-methylcitrate dehydratase PrpD